MAKNIKTDNNSKDTRHQYFNLDDDKSIFDEVDEDLRNEKFRQLINKYGGAMLAGLIIVISLVVSYEKIITWKLSKAENRTVKYIQAINPSDKYENNIIELENIINTEKGIYREIAQLRIANILIDNNQVEKGLGVLEKIYSDQSIDIKVREIATIKLATYKSESSSFSEMEALLSQIIAKNGAWTPIAKEILAMSAIFNKDVNKAKSLYQDLLTNSEISDDAKARINDVLASLAEEK